MVERRTDYGDDRGASEVLGSVLLIAVVISGALVVAYFGASAVGSVKQQQDGRSSKIGVQEIDSRLSSLAASGSATIANFEIGKNIKGHAYLQQNDGFLNVTVDRRGDCAVQESLDSIRVETNDDQLVAYEAGGTWVRGAGNGSVMRTAPDVSFRNGTLDVSLLNMSGSVEGGVNKATVNVSTSRVRTKNSIDTLLQGECVRPDNVTLRVRSDFYKAWADYLSKETGLKVGAPASPGDSHLRVDQSTGTVTVYLNQSALPRRTDDSRNNVVNVTGADYMDAVSVSNDGIMIDKGVDNTYTVYSEPISKQVDVGTVQRISQSDNVTRHPIDVVFVVDESGSMGDPAGSSGLAKYQAVREAMRNFTTYLDSDVDRVGLVGYNQYYDMSYPYLDEGSNRGYIYRTGGRMLTQDFSSFNTSTVSSTKDYGGTYSAGGMTKAASLLDLRSNETRNQIVVLLTDGKNTGHDTWHIGTQEFTGSNTATVESARRANETGTTTYTVGFGNRYSIDESFLRDTAQAGGGEYHFAANSSELQDVFAAIAQRISSSRQVAHAPMTTNLSVGGTVHPPQITGDTSRIATTTKNGRRFLNVNDPTAPSTFSHAFAVSGGDVVDFSATRFGCDKWAGTGQTQVINGTVYPVTRCSKLNTTDPMVVEGDNVTVFTNDDSATFNDFLSNTTSASWQANLTDVLDNYGGLYNASSQQLTLQSNQVLVMYDFPDGRTANGGHTDNRMLMLYSVGLSEEEAKPSGIIDFDVHDVVITN